MSAYAKVDAFYNQFGNIRCDHSTEEQERRFIETRFTYDSEWYQSFRTEEEQAKWINSDFRQFSEDCLKKLLSKSSSGGLFPRTTAASGKKNYSGNIIIVFWVQEGD